MQIAEKISTKKRLYSLRVSGHQASSLPISVPKKDLGLTTREDSKHIT